MSDHYTFFAGSDAAGQGTTVYAPGSLRGMSLPGQSLPAELAARAEYPVVFPNLMTGLQSDHFYLIDVLPDGPERTRERFEIFFFGDEAMTGELEAIRSETIERWDTRLRRGYRRRRAAAAGSCLLRRHGRPLLARAGSGRASFPAPSSRADAGAPKGGRRRRIAGNLSAHGGSAPARLLLPRNDGTASSINS